MPQLKILSCDSEQCLELTEDFYFLGRDEENDIVLGDRYVSRWCCTIFRSKNGYRVMDGSIDTLISSRNGIYINGDRLSPNSSHELFNGDEVRLSHQTLILYLDPETPDENQKDTVPHEFASA